MKPARWVRVLVPALLILAWLAAASVGGPYFGRIAEVSTNDQASYLPASAEGTRVAELVPEFTGSDDPPAIVLFVRPAGLEPGDAEWVGAFAERIPAIEGVGDALSPPIPSADGEAIQLFVPVEGSAAETVEAIRAELSGVPPGLEGYVTGLAGFLADLTGAFAGIDGLLLLVAIIAVFVILLIVYRSPLLPFIVLGTSVFALAASILVVWWLAYAGIVTINGQVQGILFILVIGAATDYSLLYVARFREALRVHVSRWDATRSALRGTIEPVLASAGTVIAGLLCLLFSDLNSNRALGPVASIGIVFAVLSAMTLLPALLLLAGRSAFWPFRPRHGSAAPVLTGSGARGLWPGIARLVSRRSGWLWVGSLIVLVLGAAGVTQLRADGVPQSELVLGASEARDGQVALGEHFPGGSGSPAIVVGDESLIVELTDAAARVDLIDSVAAVSADAPSGTIPLAGAADASSGTPGGPPGEVLAVPTVVDGRVMLQATLTVAADSADAEQAVRELRLAVQEVDPGAIVGGVTAIDVDTKDTSIRDRTLIIPLVLLVILGVLALLLRSIFAPLILVATTVLSFGTAVGVAAIVFNEVLDFPGADPAVPLYAFVFLVALGIDYNIFLMTRVREESLVHGTREGILRGLAVTGGVITSAGVVLAATFAALGVIPILFLVQIAFIVAFGVLLDTLLVRTLLVPALALDIGRAIWWPSKLWRTDAGHRGAHAADVPVDEVHRGAHAAPTVSLPPAGVRAADELTPPPPR